ncbi:MAG: (2Fe-2S)-binding protein [Clostridium sp.]|uniref:(2Fe-2S)-binding protein n=1 Tax=Clostridium sp. TaxID=1506 RepID=UPI002FC7F917
MENNNINQEVMDKLTKVCVCKAIPRSKIKDAIRNGATTMDEVKKVTGAGTGCCGGSRCVFKIQKLIEEYQNGEYK